MCRTNVIIEKYVILYKFVDMKKLFVFVFAVFVSLNALAQLEVKVGSFKEVPGFVNVNPDDNYQTDDNDLPFAVVKVRTENINDKQRRELIFEGNAGTFIMLEYKTGEVWVYLTAKYADYLKISHADFSSVEFTFPEDLKAKCGYELTLVNKTSNVSGSGSLTITTKPENGATVMLNGKMLSQKTPYKNDMIAAGQYDITVIKDRYKTVTQTVLIADGENKNIEIDMPINVALITFTADNNTEIYIDGVLMQKGTWSGELNSGIHEVVYKKQYYNDEKQSIVVEAGVPQSYELQTTPIYGKMNILSEPSGATVYVDGKEYGVTPLEVDGIIVGPHELEFRKAGCASLAKSCFLDDKEVLYITETLETGREIIISTEEDGDKIFVDGKYIGLSPVAVTISFTGHNIEAVRDEKKVQKSINVTTSSESSVKLQIFDCKNKTFTVNGVAFEMVAVNAGTFEMGDTSIKEEDTNSSNKKSKKGKKSKQAEEYKKPTHTVSLSGYYIGKCEVTIGLWKAVMGNNPTYNKNEKLPVDIVSWDDCQEFIKKLNEITGENFRLPTEAEWEFAARGGNKSRGYKYSGSDDEGKVGWIQNNAGAKTHPVATKVPNELGIYDMCGNVSEWCQDYYADYSGESRKNPTGPATGYSRVRRGGGWSYVNTPVWYRTNSAPNFRWEGIGFRLALGQ